MKLPTREYCEQLFETYKIPINIRKHCEKVCDVSLFLAKRLKEAGEEVDLDLVERLSLVHDLMKAITIKKLEKDDRFKMPEPTREELEMWKKLKEKYDGMRETEVTALLLQEEYPEFAQFVKTSGDVLEDESVAVTEKPIEIQISTYSDARVLIDDIISLKDRIKDAFERYEKVLREKGIELWDERNQDLFLIEKRIFDKIGLKPEELEQNL